MMKVTAVYVVFSVDVIIEDNDKKWRGMLKEVSGKGYQHLFELTVGGTLVGELFKRSQDKAWEFRTRSGKGEELAEQLGSIVEQFLPMKPTIRLTRE